MLELHVGGVEKLDSHLRPLHMLLLFCFANAFVILGWFDAVCQRAALWWERVGAHCCGACRWVFERPSRIGLPGGSCGRLESGV